MLVEYNVQMFENEFTINAFSKFKLNDLDNDLASFGPHRLRVETEPFEHPYLL